MSIWWLSAIIAGAGGLGGVANALVSDNGFVRWKTEVIGGTRIWRPGMAGNVILGAIGAFISWGLYGRYAGADVIGGSSSDATFTESLAAVAGAMLIGVAGARFLTSEVDRRMLQQAAAKAAVSDSSAAKAVVIATSTPAAALEVAGS